MNGPNGRAGAGTLLPTVPGDEGGGWLSAITVNGTPFEVPPPVCTVTLPDPAPSGTIATTALGVQLTTVAATPLKLTVPAVDPRWWPISATCVPAAPAAGEA